MKKAGSGTNTKDLSLRLEKLREDEKGWQESIKAAKGSGFYYSCAGIMDARTRIIQGIQAEIRQIEKKIADDLKSLSPSDCTATPKV